MGDFLRSEDMALCQIFIPVEAAYSVVYELGEIGMVQFKDLNENVQLLQKNFAKQVLRCYDMERILKYMASEVVNSKIDLFTGTDSAKAQFTPNKITALENEIRLTEKELKKLNKNTDRLKTYSIQLQEFKYVLQNTEEFLKQRDEVFEFDFLYTTERNFQNILDMDRFNLFTGVINKEVADTFEKLVWRISRGCAFFKRKDVQQPIIDSKGNKQYKAAFVICCHGDQLTSKLRKLCDGFRASLYTCPSMETERQKVIDDINERLTDLELISNQTDALRRRFLISVANQWYNWSTMVKKIKAVYHTLNYLNLDVTGKCLIGECWVPVKDIPTIKEALAAGSSPFSSVSPFLCRLRTCETPPTYNRTNKYTFAFQNLIEVYGTAKYKEANPDYSKDEIINNTEIELDPKLKYDGYPYEFGIDPVWGAAHNEVQFLNSYKMKVSIILGVIHMILGLCISIINYSLFLWLVVMVFLKWIMYSASSNDVQHGSSCAPSILVCFIDMMLFKKSKPPYDECKVYLFNQQPLVQTILVSIAATTIPVMLFGKPLLMCCTKKKIVYDKKDKFDQETNKDVNLERNSNSKDRLNQETNKNINLEENVNGKKVNLNQETTKDNNLEENIYKTKKNASTHITITENFDIKSDIKYTENSFDLQNSVTFYTNEEYNYEPEHKESESMSEVLVMQVIDTIEYALGTVSHTASYLRLWALSLAHNELQKKARLCE